MCIPTPRRARVPESRDAGPSVSSLYDKPIDGLAVIRTHKGRRNCGIDGVDGSVTFAHIDGHPFLWAIEGLLGKAPALKTIQVIPSMYPKIRGAMKLCVDRGVQVVRGHYKPEMAWNEPRIVSPVYEEQRRFMLNLSGEQRGLYNELHAMGFEEAHIASRYYCLNDEDFMPQRLVAKEYGFSEACNHAVSEIVLAVLHYLDCTVDVGSGSRRRSGFMRQRVDRLRPYMASAELRLRLPQELGIARLAENFPLAKIDALRGALEARRNGRLESLRLRHVRQHDALVLRYGLDDLENGVYRTLEDVGKLMGGITRERARQLEELALAFLGVADT